MTDEKVGLFEKQRPASIQSKSEYKQSKRSSVAGTGVASQKSGKNGVYINRDANFGNRSGSNAS